MKASTLNFHSIHQKAKSFSSNKNIIILVLLFVSGLIFGAFSVKSQNSFLYTKAMPIYMSYVKSKSGLSDLSIFFTTMLLNSSVIVLSYFTGLCAIGVPFVAMIPAVSGIFIGSVSGYIYQTYMLKGLGYCGIIIFPAAAVTAAAIIFAGRESLIMSKNMLNLLSQRHNQQYEDFKSYSVRFGIYLALAALGALIETVMTHLFIGIFNF